MTGWAVPGFVHVRQGHVDAMGRRVIARHRVNRRNVSIIYLAPELLADAEQRNRFATACERLAQIGDASVVRVHQYVECGDNAAIVADHIEGTPLRVVLLEEGAIGTEAAVVVLKDVLRGIAAAHAVGLVHGDLRPEDVVLTSAGRARLVEFGFSACVGRRLQAPSSPFYLAPEQWSGEPATEPGDLYAATVTFFECLVGAPPFHADRSAALFALHERGAPPLDAVPEPVRELVRSGLAKDPANRPSARSFLTRVEAAATDGLGHGWERRGRRELSRLLTRPSHPADVPVVPGPRGRRHRERHMRLAGVLGGALVLAAGLSSPPLPGAPLPGSHNLSDPADRPPVLAFPGPANGSPTGSSGSVHSPVHSPAHSPAVNPPPGPQSAALAEPVGPFGSTDPGWAESNWTAPFTASRVGTPGEVHSDQRVPRPSVPGAVPLTPRTYASTPAESPASPEPEQPPAPSEQEPPAPSEQQPQDPAPSEPEAQEPGAQEPGAQEPSNPSESDPSNPENADPEAPSPSEPDSDEAPSAPSEERQGPTPRVVQATLPDAADSECGSAGGPGDADVPAAQHGSESHR